MPTTKDEEIPQGTMKLLDRLIEKTIDKSKSMKNMVVHVKKIAAAVENLTLSVATLAKTMQIHQVALEELYAQRTPSKLAKETGLDLEMPSPLPKDKVEKPN